MASDSFTNTNNTALATHDSNWDDADGTCTVGDCEIYDNQCRATGDWDYPGARYTASSADLSQIVIKGQPDADNHWKFACVRLDGTTNGYGCTLWALSGSDWTNATLYKNGSGGIWTWLANGTGTWAKASDHTIKITASGTSTVSLEGFIDGSSEITTSDSTSPHGSGNPGFVYLAGGTQANSYFDDWTDGEAAGPAYTSQARTGRRTGIGGGYGSRR